MEIKEIESRLKELKGQQSEVFTKKKGERDVSVLDGIREEMAQLKEQAKQAYTDRKAEKKSGK